MSSVKIEFTADDHDLLASYQRQQAEILKNQRALLRMGEAGKKSTGDTSVGLGKMTTQLAQMVLSYGLVTRAASAWMDANREIIQQAEEAGKKYDELFRKFNVQAGLRGLEGEAAKKKILGSAERFAVPEEQAKAAAQQLVSSGFSTEQATGKALDEVLSILAASNIRGQEVDPTELTLSISKYLNSQGLDLTAENIRSVGRPVQGLFRNTNIQLPQLSALSKEAANFTGKLSVPEQLATFSQLVDVFEPEVAATGMRNVVGRLATAAETPTRVKALERLGLMPQQVDFVGEGAFDVFGRLQQGLQSVPEEQRAGLLKQLFEERGVAPAQVLLSNLDEIKRRTAGVGDTGGFLSDLAEATSGRNAASIRQDIRRNERRAARDQRDDLVKEELAAALEEEGYSPLSVRLQTGSFGYEGARFFGVSQERALRSNIPFGADVTAEQITQRVNDRMASALEQNTRATQENTRASGPSAPPAAGLSRTN